MLSSQFLPIDYERSRDGCYRYQCVCPVPLSGCPGLSHTQGDLSPFTETQASEDL